VLDRPGSLKQLAGGPLKRRRGRAVVGPPPSVPGRHERRGPAAVIDVSESLIGVSTETVLRYVRRGDLPAVRLPGGAIRLRSDDLDAWLSGRAVGSPDAR
jgi:excisionase family DNA binding protein